MTNSKYRKEQAVNWASDAELLDELMERCQKRLALNPHSTLDEKMIRLMYDCGKLLIQRV